MTNKKREARARAGEGEGEGEERMASRLVFMVGSMLRETGQAMDRLGCTLMGNMAAAEMLSRHRPLMGIYERFPMKDPAAFVAPSASVIGNVTIGKGSSVWYSTVVRGDVNHVTIGENTNIQDACVVHCSRANLGGKVLPTLIGDNVTVGHGAVLHACTLKDESFVGMSATILDGATVETGAMVAAGALVTPGATVPSGELWAGVPAKKIRALVPEEREHILKSAANYAELAVHHAKETDKGFKEIYADIERRKEEMERTDDYDSHLVC